MSDDLWPRLLAAGVRWREGMRSIAIPRDLLLDGESDSGRIPDDPPAWDRAGKLVAKGSPDLTDPATIGCLLAEVRRLSGDPRAQVAPVGSMWVAYYRAKGRKRMDAEGAPTEGAALLAALAALVGVTP